MRTLPFAAIALLLARSALAGDGVLEINQSCAVNGGCFAGDTAGYPVTIASPGSYRLTGNLAIPDADTDGIVISASSVTLDLGGFEVAGPVVCQGTPTTCNPASGTGTGIEVGSAVDTWVKNGVVRGMGFRGVDLNAYSIAENLEVTSNRAQQILVGTGSIVRNCVATLGGNVGIFTGAGSIVSGNSVSNHGNTGISTGSGSTITGNASYQNQSDGIATSSGATIAGNQSYANLGDGVQTTSSSSVQRNTIRENSGFGINNVAGIAPTGYRNNTILLNQGGAVDGGIDQGGNLCSTISPCP